MFGEYLKHFGLFSTTVAIALLACALKGYLQLVVALHKVVDIIQRWVVIEVFRMYEYAIQLLTKTPRSVWEREYYSNKYVFPRIIYTRPTSKGSNLQAMYSAFCLL